MKCSEAAVVATVEGAPEPAVAAAPEDTAL